MSDKDRQIANLESDLMVAKSELSFTQIDLRAAEAKLAAIAEGNRWLPIDQAKKDRTSYLLWLPIFENQGVARVGFWKLASKCWGYPGPGVYIKYANPTHFQYITPPEDGDAG